WYFDPRRGRRRGRRRCLDPRRGRGRGRRRCLDPRRGRWFGGWRLRLFCKKISERATDQSAGNCSDGNSLTFTDIVVV
ncbi:MAG: hypothetical protein ACE5FB_04560, partial [Candidatus Binatia bacterium]